jgi:hypothetical protein
MSNICVPLKLQTDQLHYSAVMPWYIQKFDLNAFALTNFSYTDIKLTRHPMNDEHSFEQEDTSFNTTRILRRKEMNHTIPSSDRLQYSFSLISSCAQHIQKFDNNVGQFLLWPRKSRSSINFPRSFIHYHTTAKTMLNPL